MKITHAALLALPIAASIACGSGLNGHDGGAGGTGGSAGTGGRGSGGGTAGTSGTGGATTSTGGTGGSGGTGGTVAVKPPPSCLRDLIADCPLTGSCQRADADGGVQQSCYASGVKVVSTTLRKCVSTQSVDMMSILEVYNADGTLCYKQESHCECPQGCETIHLTWRNAAGDSVATGYKATVTSVMCTETGETCTGPWDSSTGKFPCLPPEPDQACTAGSCP